MAITYGFFNSLNGDRVYDAATVSNMFKGLISNGVYQSVGNAFRVSAAGGLTVRVGTGRAIVGDRWVENDAAETLTLTSPHVTLNRYTAVILRRDLGTRDVKLMTIDGANASRPSKPQPTRTSDVYDIVLAYVYVAAGASAITAGNIQDTRANSSLCGFVVGIVKTLDTSQMFDQYTALYQEQLVEMQEWEDDKKERFDNWFDALTQELRIQTYIESKRVEAVAQGDDLSTLSIPSSLGYDKEGGDILHVYVNGLQLPAERFSIIGNPGNYSVQKATEFLQGDLVEFVCLKSAIGPNPHTTVTYDGSGNVVIS